MVVDANIMWHHWWLTGTSWDNMRDLVDHGRIDFYVPEVVVQEVARGRRHDANELVEELNQVNLSRIERLLNLGLPTRKNELASKVHALVADYDTELRARLTALGAEIVPVPSVSHQAILARALENRRPFDEHGRNGYRDALIWHSLLDIAELGYDGIVFATNNTSDFCTGKPAVLLPALVKELADASPRAEVLLAASINEIDTRVEEMERLVEAKPASFARPDEAAVQAALTDCIDIIVAGGKPPTPGRWGEDLNAGWPFFSILEEEPVEAVSIDLEPATLTYVPVGDDWEEFIATVRAEVTLDGFAFKPDYYIEDRVRLDVQDPDWNNHYMHVWEYHDADLIFRLTLNEDRDIEECWLTEAEEILSPETHSDVDEP